MVDFKKILDEVAKSESLSIHKVLAYNTKCETCLPTIPTNEFNEDGIRIHIKRVSLNIPQGSGLNVITHAKKRIQIT